MLSKAFQLLVLLILAQDACAAYPQFKTFYPDLGPTFQHMLRHECATLYQNYTAGRCPSWYYEFQQYAAFPPTPKLCKTLGSQQLTNCLLKSSLEINSANMNNAGVLLGLLPAVLSMAGTTTIEAGVLALRRPLLSLLLSAGSPAVSPLRTFDYRDPVDLLQIREGGGSSFSTVPKRWRGHPKRWHALISILEYFFAMAAAANLAYSSWELSYRTVCSLAAQTSYLPVVWAFTAVLIHIAGMVAVAFRVHLICNNKPEVTTGITAQESGWLAKLFAWFKQKFHPAMLNFRLEQELRPTASHEHAEIEVRKESKRFIFTSWLTSTGTILHLIFGTLVLSGTLFISAKDSIKLTCRFLMSTLICRAVLTYEMRGIRRTVSVKASGAHGEVEEHGHPYEMLRKTSSFRENGE